MPTVVFKVDAEKEYEYHTLFHSNPMYSWMSGFATDEVTDKQTIISKIQEYWDDKGSEFLEKYEFDWRPIERNYFQKITEICGYKFQHDKYTAYPMAYSNIGGFADPVNFDGNEIIITDEVKKVANFVIGHELFHVQYRHIIKDLDLLDANKALLLEGVAALVFFETDLKSLFPEMDQTRIDKSIDSYPTVRENWTDLVKLWGKRDTFEGFLNKAVAKFS